MDRSEITLKNTIGVGQFGDVYIGSYNTKVKCGAKADKNDSVNSAVIQVAVKTCKANDDPEKMERFLEEACKFICNCNKMKYFPLNCIFLFIL